jgi:hypothetical protein
MFGENSYHLEWTQYKIHNHDVKHTEILTLNILLTWR